MALSDDFYAGVNRKYWERREYLIPELRKLGFRISTPQSAYYAFCDFGGVAKLKEFYDKEDDLGAAMYLLKEVGVASVPGSNFYSPGTDNRQHYKKYLRICFCRDLNDLKEAVKRMQKLLA